MEQKPAKKPEPPKVTIPKKDKKSDGGFWPLLAGVICAFILIGFVVLNMVPVPLNFFGLKIGSFEALSAAGELAGDSAGDAPAAPGIPASYVVKGGVPVWLLVIISVGFGYLAGRIRFTKKPKRKGGLKVL